MKILLIDDEKDLCEVVKESLELEGYEVKLAHSGENALLELKQDTFDALMVDLRLEGFVSGMDIIKHYKDVPCRPKIIAVSGTPREAVTELFERENVISLVDRIMEKPSDIRPDNISKIMKTILDKA